MFLKYSAVNEKMPKKSNDSDTSNSSQEWRGKKSKYEKLYREVAKLKRKLKYRSSSSDRSEIESSKYKNFNIIIYFKWLTINAKLQFQTYVRLVIK